MSSPKPERDAMKSLLREEKQVVKFGQENICELKNEMKEAIKEEYQELKSGIRPSIATKIYPWRRYLNKVFTSEVPDYKHSKINEDSLSPFDPVAAKLTVFYNPNKPSNISDFVDYSRISSVRCINGIFKIQRPPIRVIEEKSPYFPMMPNKRQRSRSHRNSGYALDWPFVDENGGHSIYGRYQKS